MYNNVSSVVCKQTYYVTDTTLKASQKVSDISFRRLRQRDLTFNAHRCGFMWRGIHCCQFTPFCSLHNTLARSWWRCEEYNLDMQSLYVAEQKHFSVVLSHLKRLLQHPWRCLLLCNCFYMSKRLCVKLQSFFQDPGFFMVPMKGLGI